MFFNNIDEIAKIALKTDSAVFVMPKEVVFNMKKALVISPETKTSITIEQIRDLMSKISMRQLEDSFVIIRPADLLNEIAANALLKSLEEPKEKIHYILITDAPSKLLPTILSRTAMYFMKEKSDIDKEIGADENIKTLAKKIMIAKPADLIDVAEQIVKKKDGVRAYALAVVGAAIEMLYKSYFITNKPVFLKKIPKFLKLYENIENNGHIKLHLVADLI
ncbi:hypothetical protein IJJ05_00630 [Candidatus Saccharibacteria bacterium]|nr:hypothetical protein [Candidatus Saccharibacteria bacterium]